MPLINITHTATTQTGGVTNIPNATDGNNMTFAVIPSTATLTFENFNGLADPSNLTIGDPTSTIEYVRISTTIENVSAWSSNLKLGVQLLNGTTPITGIDEFVLPNGKNTLVCYVARNTLNTLIERKLIADNSNFKVRLSAINTNINLYEVSFDIQYVKGVNSVGELSTFPVAVDSFPELDNTTDPNVFSSDFIITADELNRLTDAVTSTQRVLIGDAEYIRTFTGKRIIVGKDRSNKDEVILFTYILRGTRLNNFFGRYYLENVSGVDHNVQQINNYVGQTNQQTPIPVFGTNNIVFEFVTGVGWLTDVGGSTRYPVHVSPTIVKSVSNSPLVSYQIGFTLQPGLITDSTLSTRNATTGLTISHNTSQDGIYDNISNTFEIRICALGRVLP